MGGCLIQGFGAKANGPTEKKASEDAAKVGIGRRGAPVLPELTLVGLLHSLRGEESKKTAQSSIGVNLRKLKWGTRRKKKPFLSVVAVAEKVVL